MNCEVTVEQMSVSWSALNDKWVESWTWGDELSSWEDVTKEK